MDKPPPDSFDEWAETARGYLAAARGLRSHHQWRSIHVLCGYALECALKAQIMRHHGMNRWPSRKERRDLYQHACDQLARYAGLAEVLDAEALAGSRVGIAWMVAKGHVLEARYPDGKPFPVRVGRDMVDALDDGGLLEWILAFRR